MGFSPSWTPRILAQRDSELGRENGCGKDKLGNVVVGNVGRVCANFWDPFASILF